MPEKETPLFYIVLAISLAILSLFLLFIIILTVIFNKRKSTLLIQNQILNEELRIAGIEIREQVLQDVAMEIHDNVPQILGLVNLNMNYIASDDEYIKKNIETTKLLIKSSINELRSMSHRLQGENILENGLFQAICQQVEWVNRTQMYKVEFSADCNLPAEFENDKRKILILFRMIQELLNNALKHSKASVIKIGSQMNCGFFELYIVDNGIGFMTNSIENNKGLGMTTLRKRAELIKAILIIESSINTGLKTTIRFKL